MIKPGDTLVCNKYIPFVDGTCHYRGQLVEVQEDELSYYELFIGKHYSKLSERDND